MNKIQEIELKTFHFAWKFVKFIIIKINSGFVKQIREILFAIWSERERIPFEIIGKIKKDGKIKLWNWAK